jgi:arylsulfatase
LPVAKVRIKLGEFDETKAVQPTDMAVRFSAPLSAGPAELQTWCYDTDGREICGAYYVYVERSTE